MKEKIKISRNEKKHFSLGFLNLEKIREYIDVIAFNFFVKPLTFCILEFLQINCNLLIGKAYQKLIPPRYFALHLAQTPKNSSE